MSRIGKLPVTVPAGVDVTIDGTTVTAKGAKGELTRTFPEIMTIKREGDDIIVERPNDSREARPTTASCARSSPTWWRACLPASPRSCSSWRRLPCRAQGQGS